jgi:photosystem II stability/assembly factor-like uncharacterized protein
MRSLNPYLFIFIGIAILSACRKKESQDQSVLSICDGGHGQGWTKVLDFNNSEELSFIDGCAPGLGVAYCLVKSNANKVAPYEVYKSTDCGGSWNRIYAFANTHASSIFFTDAKHGYIGAANDSLFETVDGGVTWTGHINDENHVLPRLKAGANTFIGAALARNLQTQWLSYISFDNGVSWQVSYISGFSNTSFYGSGSGYLSDGFLYRTIDDGRHWNLIKNSVSCRDISFPDGLHGLAIVDSIYADGPPTWDIPFPTLCRTEDGGEHFTKLNAACTRKIPNYSNGLICSRSLGESYLATTDGVYKSTDFGSTWTLDVSNAGTQKIIFNGNLGLAFAGDGIYKKN